MAYRGGEPHMLGAGRVEGRVVRSDRPVKRRGGLSLAEGKQKALYASLRRKMVTPLRCTVGTYDCCLTHKKSEYEGI